MTPAPAATRPAKESLGVLQDNVLRSLAHDDLRGGYCLDFCRIQASNQLLGRRLQACLWFAHPLIEVMVHLLWVM